MNNNTSTHFDKLNVKAQLHRLPNIHPGEILKLDFLEPLNITPYRLSKDLSVAQTRIGEILAGKRSITADTALRLSRYFGNSPQFWLNLQTDYDLRQAQAKNAEVYNQIPITPFTFVALGPNFMWVGGRYLWGGWDWEKRQEWGDFRVYGLGGRVTDRKVGRKRQDCLILPKKVLFDWPPIH